MKTLTARYQQAHKEAIWAVALAVGYFIWWYASAYFLSPAPDAINAMPTLYFGFPLWFLMACIIGPIVFTLLCMAMVKWIYKDISLEVDEQGEMDEIDELNADFQHKTQGGEHE